MSKVVCPGCGGQFRAPENAAGKRFRCPKCGGVISVTAAGVAAGATSTVLSKPVGAAPTVSATARAPAAVARGGPAAIARPPLAPPRIAAGAAPRPGHLAPRPAPPPMAPVYAAPPAPPAAFVPAPVGTGPTAPAKKGGIPLWLILGGVGVAAVVALAIGATVIYLLFFGSRVTQANFDQLKPGMTRAQVEEVLGKPTQSQDVPFFNINASVWSDRKKAIVVWFQDGKEINKIITDGPVSVSGPPPGMDLKASDSGNPLAALGGAGNEKGSTEKKDPAVPAAFGATPEQQRQMEEAFREAMKTFPTNGQTPAAPQTGSAGTTATKDGTDTRRNRTNRGNPKASTHVDSQAGG